MTELLVERIGEAVCVLRIDRPSARNALNASVRAALIDQLAQADADSSVRCIVLAGGVRAFCAGADLKELQPEVGPIELLMRETERFWNAVAAVRKPIVAAVRGCALGGGCELAMLADVIVAGDKATFGLPEIKVGLMPGAGGTQRLPRACGLPQAMLALLTGEPFSAQRAYEMGLVSQVVPDDMLDERALEIATTIASRPALAIRQIKEVVRRGADCSLDSALMLERSALQVLMASADRAEGVSAFAQKRPPRFTGR